MVQTDSQAAEVIQVQLDQLDCQARLVSAASPDQPDLLDSEVKRDSQDPQDRLDQLVPQDPGVKLDFLVNGANRDNEERAVHQERQVC